MSDGKGIKIVVVGTETTQKFSSSLKRDLLLSFTNPTYPETFSLLHEFGWTSNIQFNIKIYFIFIIGKINENK